MELYGTQTMGEREGEAKQDKQWGKTNELAIFVYPRVCANYGVITRYYTIKIINMAALMAQIFKCSPERGIGGCLLVP